jgi:hypothetical protein
MIKMSKLTTEQYERFCNDDEYTVITMNITEKNMHKAEMIIDAFRIYHRRIGDKFIGHYCLCNEQATQWKFVYDAKVGSTEADDIERELGKHFEFVFKEEVKRGVATVFDGVKFSSSDKSPCVCPYSFK